MSSLPPRPSVVMGVTEEQSGGGERRCVGREGGARGAMGGEESGCRRERKDRFRKQEMVILKADWGGG